MTIQQIPVKPDFPTASWFPSQNMTPGHDGLHPLFIELHTTPTTSADETPAAIALAHEGAGESMHYIIGQDGSVLQCVAEVDSAKGSGDLLPGHVLYWNRVDCHQHPDYVTFNIEVLTAEDGTISQDALASAFVLIKDMTERHRITPWPATDNGGIHGHNSVDTIRFAHCGRDFPYQQLFDYLQGIEPTIEDRRNNNQEEILAAEESLGEPIETAEKPIDGPVEETPNSEEKSPSEEQPEDTQKETPLEAVVEPEPEQPEQPKKSKKKVAE